MLVWLKRLFFPAHTRHRASPIRALSRSRAHENQLAGGGAGTPVRDRHQRGMRDDDETRGSSRAGPLAGSKTTGTRPPANAQGAQGRGPSKGRNLDREAHLSTVLKDREADFLARIDARIARGSFELPHIAATSLAVIDLAAKPSAEIPELVKLIAPDPVLSSELLKTANSVLYAGTAPADTLHQAVVRVGLRAMRSLVFSISVKGAILSDKGLSEYAEEVWRQSYSMASIARKTAVFARMDPEKSFLVGLLHDIGKVSLLAMLRSEVHKGKEITPTLVGRVFHKYHERAGAAVARAWKLPEEIVVVAGGHHRFAECGEHARAAALSSLAHKLDLYLSLDSEVEFRNLAHAPEMEFLEIGAADRHALLSAAQQAFFADVESLSV